MRKIIIALVILIYLSIPSINAQSNYQTLNTGDSASVNIEVEEKGNYNFKISYIPLSSGSEDILYQLSIDGKEIDEIYTLDKQFELEDEEIKLDRYGNEIPSDIVLTQNVITDYVHIKEQRNNQGISFELAPGQHEVTITILQGSIDFVSMEAVNVETMAYSDYANGEQTSIEPIIIEAERPTYKNMSSIQSTYSGDIEAAPYSYKNQYINVIGGESFASPGKEVTYSVEISEAGYYPLTLKYLVPDDTMAPYITVYINGEVPFNEVENYRLPVSDSFITHTIGGEDPYLFYLEEGTNTITIALNFATYDTYVAQLVTLNEMINEIYLEVQKVTGNNEDKNIAWDLTSYIPTLEEDINNIYSEVERILNELIALNDGNTNKVTHYLEMALDTLYPFTQDINQLAYDLDLLYASTTSVGSYISSAIIEINKTPVLLDQIYVGGDSSVYPEYEKNILEKVGYGALELAYSFIGSSDEQIEYTESIDVWVFRAQQYVDVLQVMVDEQFSPVTGIKVNLSIMTTDQQLLLANAANTAPDVVLGMPYDKIYEYGVRGAAYELSSFEDFDEVASQFLPASLVPYAVDGGVYGLPETLDFNVLFYRTDIVEEYGLEVPETWDDVAALMPTLDRYSMTFYSSLSGGAGTKTITQTSPFFLQSGCTFYDEETYTTTLDSEACVEAMTTMSELFTVYGVPLQIPNFFEYFRSGKAPMGVANFSTYLQLVSAAPELEGKWAIAPIPGTVQEDGTISHAAPSAAQGTFILQNTDTPDAAWEFVKWWLSTETQTEYAYRLYYQYGTSYLWNTANVEAFAQGPFPEEHKEVILEQWSYMEEPPKIPGSYMLEREISNAWNAIVFEGKNIQEQIENAKINIDREIKNKMQEFGYMDEDGNIIKPYNIPTTEEMEELVNE